MNRPLPLLLVVLLCVSITADSHPRKRDRRFEMRNKFYRVNYKGEKGMDGLDGDTRLGNLVPFHPPSDGRNGKNGSSGPKLFCRVSVIRFGDSVVLSILIRKNHDKLTNCYYVNPTQGKMLIDAGGGNGGAGGAGGEGKANKCRNYGGDGGNGGKGGMGGTIDMIYDSAALAYVDCACICFDNRGGIGGHYGPAGEGSGCGPNGAEGMSGVPGLPGPPVTIRDQNGRILRIVTEASHP